MNDVVKQLLWFAALLAAAGAWVTYAHHPTARNLRIAIIDTLGL
jgi:hypothetical protein